MSQSKLPASIAKLAEEAAPVEVCWCAGPTCSGCEKNTLKLWLKAIAWYHEHLQEQAPAFNEAAAIDAAIAHEHPTETIGEWYVAGVRRLKNEADLRWEPTVRNLRAEVERLKRELPSFHVAANPSDSPCATTRGEDRE